VRQFDGVHVGFVAAVTRSTPGSVMPAGIRGWRFGREVEAINRAVDALVARGVHAVVAVVHEGGETDGGWNDCERPRGAIFDIARRLHPAVALVLSAHTHRAYRCTLDGRLIVQAASYGRLVSVVDLALDRRGGTVIVERSAAVNVPVPNDRNDSPSVRAAYPPLAADAEVARLVAHYAERAAPLALRPAGRIAATFERRAAEGADSAAGRLVADAHLAATRAQGARIAFTNPGGIRSDLIARTGADTEVTFGDLFMMQPFGNHLVTMTLSGAQIRALLEDQWSRSHTRRVRLLQPSRGFTYAWRAGAPEGQRIVADSLILDGEAIEPDRPYRVTVNGYLAAGGDAFGILRTGRDRVSGPLDVEALMGFIRRESRRAPLAPDPVPRIRRID
jgi:5'-nucleotidase